MTRKNLSDGSHLDIQGSVSGLSMWIAIKDVPLPLSVCGRQYGAVRPYLRWPSLFGIAGYRDFVKRVRFLPTGDLRVREETVLSKNLEECGIWYLHYSGFSGFCHCEWDCRMVAKSQVNLEDG